VKTITNHQAWVWEKVCANRSFRCNYCIYVAAPCGHIPCAPLERYDNATVVYLPNTPEGLATGAALTMDGILGGIA